MHTFDLNLNDISKMEGKASLTVVVKDDKIEKLEFAITEFKRFYTQAIRGKDVSSIPQLCSRICGTCSNAHLLCAIKAIENAYKLKVTQQTENLRKLLNFGLIIRDHALHLYIFALPDVLGIDNILELDENNAQEHQILDDLFAVKNAGNTLGKVIGGRSVHAPFPTIGGFTHIPDQKDINLLKDQLEKARPSVLRLIALFQKCDFSRKVSTGFTALMDQSYSFLNGSIIIDKETEIGESQLKGYLDRIVIPYSHATGYKFMGKTYLVGALARLNCGKEYLHENTRDSLKEVLTRFPSDNIFDNNLAQAVEILHSIDECIELLKTTLIIPEDPVLWEKQEGRGIGVIEAPRGTLYYELDIDHEGKVKTGEIIVPTSQNQILIEKVIYEFVKENLSKDKDYLTFEIEKIIRAFDPCMSCASHFLKTKWVES